MKRVTNVNRVATANTMADCLDLFQRTAGLVVQTHRAYESGRKQGLGLLQKAVARRAGVTKTVVSQLECGRGIPGDRVLRRILQVVGVRLGRGTAGEGFYQFLRAVRDHGADVRRIARERPR